MSAGSCAGALLKGVLAFAVGGCPTGVNRVVLVSPAPDRRIAASRGCWIRRVILPWTIGVAIIATVLDAAKREV